MGMLYKLPRATVWAGGRNAVVKGAPYFESQQGGPDKQAQFQMGAKSKARIQNQLKALVRTFK